MLSFGLTVAVIGIGVVFLELILLIFIIKGISLFASTIEKRRNRIDKGKENHQETTGTTLKIEACEDNDEIIAVIAAAVASMSHGTAYVKAIRCLPGTNAPAWSYAGRSETMNLRQECY